jgi:hypothetical protein
MHTPIAFLKVVELAPSGTRTPIQVEVGCPRPDGRGAWACTVEGIGSRPTEIHGEDSLQALCLGLRLVRTHLEAAIERGSTLLDADDGSEFPFRAYFEN